MALVTGRSSRFMLKSIFIVMMTFLIRLPVNSQGKEPTMRFIMKTIIIGVMSSIICVPMRRKEITNAIEWSLSYDEPTRASDDA